MKQYEYHEDVWDGDPWFRQKYGEHNSFPSFQEWLNKKGSDGWVLVQWHSFGGDSPYRSHCTFMREVQ